MIIRFKFWKGTQAFFKLLSLSADSNGVKIVDGKGVLYDEIEAEWVEGFRWGPSSVYIDYRNHKKKNEPKSRELFADQFPKNESTEVRAALESLTIS